jgi:hypothetical protein
MGSRKGQEGTLGYRKAFGVMPCSLIDIGNTSALLDVAYWHDVDADKGS